MQCVVTAGPTAEALDHVRRLTNISSGRLGMELANHLAASGHSVALLLGKHTTWSGACQAKTLDTFGSADDLRELLRGLSSTHVDALFHAAAVSDFTFGKVWVRLPEGVLSEVRAAKFSTQRGPLLAELVPTPKIIAEVRGWFPQTRIVGWKYEVEGDRTSSMQAGAAQLASCRTDACVVNGPAYGEGFGLVKGTGGGEHLAGKAELFAALVKLVLHRQLKL